MLIGASWSNILKSPENWENLLLCLSPFPAVAGRLTSNAALCLICDVCDYGDCYEYRLFRIAVCNPRHSPAQAEFIRFLNENKNELPEFSSGLKLVHDLVLYHTNTPLDDEEKYALYNIKCLWEEIDRLVKAG